MTLLRALGRRTTQVALLGAAVLVSGVGYAGLSTAEEDDARVGGARPALSAGAATVEGLLLPGGAVTGSLVVRNGSAEAVRLTSARFGPATTTAPGCADSVVFALTVEPSASTPLVLPPRSGATALGWTAFMTGEAADACQGARFSSALVLDGRRTGSAEAVAGVLSAPGRPVGGRTTATRVAVRWSPAAEATGYLLERAPAGTTDWSPACGTATAPRVRNACNDVGLQPSTAYAYRATAVRGGWRTVGGLGRDVTTRSVAR